MSLCHFSAELTNHTLFPIGCSVKSKPSAGDHPGPWSSTPIRPRPTCHLLVLLSGQSAWAKCHLHALAQAQQAWLPVTFSLVLPHKPAAALRPTQPFQTVFSMTHLTSAVLSIQAEAQQPPSSAARELPELGPSFFMYMCHLYSSPPLLAGA